MKFNQTLIEGRLVRRYKRFLADIRLNNGQMITAHCPNSGSMKTCDQPGWRVLLSDSRNPKRKLRYSWEMVHNERCWIGINTHLANKIVAEAISQNRIPELAGYSKVQSEVPYGKNSRIDLLLSKDHQQCYVEIKNVTLVEDDGFYKFPDAVTTRGLKHLNELLSMVRQNHRAVMFYLIQRSDGTLFKPAAHIDPEYAQMLGQAHERGVEILPYLARVTPQEITLSHRIDFSLE